MNRKFREKPAKARNILPERSLYLRKDKGKNVRISLFSGPFLYAFKAMQEHYWHSNFFSDITFEPVNSEEALNYLTVDEYLARDTFRWKGLSAGFYIRTPEGIYINPGKAITLIPDDYRPPKPKLNQDILKNQKDESTKVNGIYLGENGFAFAPWESFRVSKFQRDEIPAREFAEGGLARAIEHTTESIAPILYKAALDCKKKVVMLNWLDIPEKPVIGNLNIRAPAGMAEWEFGITGNSYNDHNLLRENPNEDFYYTDDNGGVVIGRVKTNKGKLL
jgi:hypothetical protein